MNNSLTLCFFHFTKKVSIKSIFFDQLCRYNFVNYILVSHALTEMILKETMRKMQQENKEEGDESNDREDTREEKGQRTGLMRG